MKNHSIHPNRTVRLQRGSITLQSILQKVGHKHTFVGFIDGRTAVTCFMVGQMQQPLLVSASATSLLTAEMISHFNLSSGTTNTALSFGPLATRDIWRHNARETCPIPPSMFEQFVHIREWGSGIVHGAVHVASIGTLTYLEGYISVSLFSLDVVHTPDSNIEGSKPSRKIKLCLQRGVFDTVQYLDDIRRLTSYSICDLLLTIGSYLKSIYETDVLIGPNSSIPVFHVDEKSYLTDDLQSAYEGIITTFCKLLSLVDPSWASDISQLFRRVGPTFHRSDIEQVYQSFLDTSSRYNIPGRPFSNVDSRVLQKEFLGDLWPQDSHISREKYLQLFTNQSNQITVN